MIEHNQKHLTLSNRIYIQQELLQKTSFSSIGSTLHKDPTTIAKEVKRYSKTVPAKHSYRCYICKHYKDCDLRSTELQCPGSQKNPYYCTSLCKRCHRRNVPQICPYFFPYSCNKINRPPYVCNYCEDYTHCPIDKRVYDAAYAQKQYEKKLYDSRKGINMTPEELQELNDLISPKKSQPKPALYTEFTASTTFSLCAGVPPHEVYLLCRTQFSIKQKQPTLTGRLLHFTYFVVYSIPVSQPYLLSYFIPCSSCRDFTSRAPCFFTLRIPSAVAFAAAMVVMYGTCALIAFLRI